MDKKSRITFGPGAASIILILVVLSMSILGILALISARNAGKLSDRSADVIEAVYALNAKAEQSYADLDGILASARANGAGESADDIQPLLPAGMKIEGNTISWEESDGVRALKCAVEWMPQGGAERLRWTEHRLSAITVDDLWN